MKSNGQNSDSKKRVMEKQISRYKHTHSQITHKTRIVQMEKSMDDMDSAEQIEFWERKLDELKSGYEKMYSGTNPIYETQLEELAQITAHKLQALERWRDQKLALIHSETSKKVSLLESERERHKADIPKLLQRSIHEQFDHLQREFAGVFSCFLDDEIPFMREFAQQNVSKVCSVDLDHPLLSSSEIRHDLEKASRPTLTYRIHGDELTSSSGSFRAGDSVVVAFGRMHPIVAVIEEIGGENVRLRPRGGENSIQISTEALEMNIVTISAE
jgi:hypothetical protein